MIIRLTVKDNDFNDLMNGFIHNLRSRILQEPSNMKEMDIDTQFEIMKRLNTINRLLNPNITEQHTDEEKQLLVNRIKDVFLEYVNKSYVCNDNNTADYLVRNFNVEIIESMEDKWENGEAWYWFQHSKVYLNQ